MTPKIKKFSGSGVTKLFGIASWINYSPIRFLRQAKNSYAPLAPDLAFEMCGLGKSTGSDPSARATKRRSSTRQSGRPHRKQRRQWMIYSGYCRNVIIPPKRFSRCWSAWGINALRFWGRKQKCKSHLWKEAGGTGICLSMKNPRFLKHNRVKILIKALIKILIKILTKVLMNSKRRDSFFNLVRRFMWIRMISLVVENADYFVLCLCVYTWLYLAHPITPPHRAELWKVVAPDPIHVALVPPTFAPVAGFITSSE